IKRGRKLARKVPEERHRIRILLKDIRYTAEFFGTFFGGSQPYIRSVSKLQDELGASTDAESAACYLLSAEAGAGPQTAKAAGIVLGWCGRGAICANGSLRQEWRTFERMRPFWR
ncbi:MAG: CHAD domain-containing protein, partial [Methylocapsa sp.]|nr:CHAD domain-containing protein [Methylocapsa sp.]